MFTTIVAPEELVRHLDDPAWIVVDCRHVLQDFSAGRKAYDAGHIPGAFFASVEEDLAGEKTGTNGRHPMPEPVTFAQFLRSIGVNDETQLVAYDAGADMFAARLWFLTKWIGHDRVAVLDGGLAAWRACGYPVSTDAHAVRAPGTLVPRVRTEAAVAVEHVLANLDSNEFELLDARASDRFAGENETIDPVAGHIPGASNRWFKQNFDDNGRLKSREALRAEFEALGIAPERVVHQCGSGVSAAVNALAMEHAGLPGWRVYPGSWSEWCADPKRPIAR
ncbi:MAG: sulfurtransferase [Vulcanimicrobiaceae bacterium]